MTALRAILSGFCFTVFGIGGFIIGTFLFPLIFLFSSSGMKGRENCIALIRFSWKIFVWLMCFLRLIKINIEAADVEKLGSATGMIIATNHPSLIDVVIMVTLVPRAVCVVKNDLLHNIWMKKIVKKICLVNDTDPDVFLREGAFLLNNGFNVIIFPEGTRTPFKAESRRIHRGFTHLSLYSGRPIIPVRVLNFPLILGKRQAWYQMGNKTSVYTISTLSSIVPVSADMENRHKNAVLMAEIFEKTLFSNV